MGDEAFEVEPQQAVPAHLLSPAWGALLSIGGLLLIVGALGYAVIRMTSYESEIAQLRAGPGGAEQAPAAPATAAPGEGGAPPAPGPTVVVTETVAATPAPTRAPAAGSANVDRTRQLEAQVISLRSQLAQAQAELERAKRDSPVQQCQARLVQAQQLAERLRSSCRPGTTILPVPIPGSPAGSRP